MIQFSVSCLLQLLAIGIPSFIAWKIGTGIQKKLDAEKSLRDYILNEINLIRNKYRLISDYLISAEKSPKFIKTELGMLRVLITDTMTMINKQDSSIDEHFLLPYQLEFSQLITEDDNFISNFKADKKFKLTKKTSDALIVFDKTNNHLFNDLITLLYKR